jgi:hypothetical protein
VDPKKIEAMKDSPHPKNLKILRGFLGLRCYYHEFVQNYGKISYPLTALLKKNEFSWTPEVDHSLHCLKEVMCTNHVLTLKTSPRLLSWNAMCQGKELGQSSCDMDDLWLSLGNKFWRNIWDN